jgi:hypothetical protein
MDFVTDSDRAVASSAVSSEGLGVFNEVIVPGRIAGSNHLVRGVLLGIATRGVCLDRNVKDWAWSRDSVTKGKTRRVQSCTKMRQRGTTCEHDQNRFPHCRKIIA